MSQYLTLLEFEQYGPPASVLSSLSPTEKTLLIEAASALAESEMGIRYQDSFPLNPVPTCVKPHVASIAYYFGLRNRGFSPQTIDELIVEDYKNAIKYFQRLAEGSAVLILSTGVVVESGGPETYSEDSRGYRMSYV